jgi:hypothetical protein
MMGVLNNRTVPPLSPEVQSLLAYERDVVSQPEIVAARAFARARESLQEHEAVLFVPRRVSWPIRRLVFAAAAGLVLTAGVAAAYQMLRPRPPRAESQIAVSRPALRTQPALEAEVAAPSPTEQVESASLLKSSASAARNSNQEELRFLLRARQADARGDYAKVLLVLAQHQREYPVGRLAEEREVLRVKAFVALGQKAKARHTADRFRHQFPRSVLLHKVNEMLTASR